MSDHPTDRLWQAWQDGDLLDRTELVGTSAVVLGGQRTYRQTHDRSVVVDDRSDPRTHTCWSPPLTAERQAQSGR
jgi:hypothetical protein